MMKECFPKHQWSINWKCSLNVDWSVLLQAREEANRENVLCRVDWLALLLASEETKRENVFCHIGWLLLLLLHTVKLFQILLSQYN